MTDAPTITEVEFANFFQSWQRLEEQKAELAEEAKDLFAHMKAKGYDTKAARAVFRDMRQELNADAADLQKAEEAEAVYDLYWTALKKGMSGPRAHPARSARENIEEFVPETGEILDASVLRRDATAVVNAYAGTASDENPAPNTPGPANPGGSDGNPSEPKDEAGGAKNGGVPAPAMDRTGTKPGIGYANSSQAVTDIHARRPHCMHKDACRGQGGEYCRTCLKALETEAA